MGLGVSFLGEPGYFYGLEPGNFLEWEPGYFLRHGKYFSD